jgi:hypothetical protein
VLVGSEVNAACTKCKAVTPHVILAKVGVKPTRVQCRTCNGAHAFKPRLVQRAILTPGMSQEQAWTASMSHARGPITEYSPTGRFAVGTRVSHPSFGEGVVARLSSATVCEVIFSTRTVKLIMAPLIAEEGLGGERLRPAGASAGDMRRRSRLHVR